MHEKNSTGGAEIITEDGLSDVVLSDPEPLSKSFFVQSKRVSKVTLGVQVTLYTDTDVKDLHTPHRKQCTCKGFRCDDSRTTPSKTPDSTASGITLVDYGRVSPLKFTFPAKGVRPSTKQVVEEPDPYGLNEVREENNIGRPDREDEEEVTLGTKPASPDLPKEAEASAQTDSKNASHRRLAKNDFLSQFCSGLTNDLTSRVSKLEKEFHQDNLTEVIKHGISVKSFKEKEDLLKVKEKSLQEAQEKIAKLEAQNEELADRTAWSRLERDDTIRKSQQLSQQLSMERRRRGEDASRNQTAQVQAGGRNISLAQKVQKLSNDLLKEKTATQNMLNMLGRVRNSNQKLSEDLQKEKRRNQTLVDLHRKMKALHLEDQKATQGQLRYYGMLGRQLYGRLERFVYIYAEIDPRFVEEDDLNVLSLAQRYLYSVLGKTEDEHGEVDLEACGITQEARFEELDEQDQEAASTLVREARFSELDGRQGEEAGDDTQQGTAKDFDEEDGQKVQKAASITSKGSPEPSSINDNNNVGAQGAAPLWELSPSALRDILRLDHPTPDAGPIGKGRDNDHANKEEEIEKGAEEKTTSTTKRLKKRKQSKRKKTPSTTPTIPARTQRRSSRRLQSASGSASGRGRQRRRTRQGP